MRIAISPDEDPGDPGSVAADGTTERSVNLRVATALQQALARCGQDVWFDASITYVDRTARANGDGTALMVACAHNESTAGLSGTQFVFCPDGQAFGRQAAAADAVYAELAAIAGWPARLGDAVEDIYECCAFNGDSLYAELLFMSPQDQVLWSRPDYGALAAEAIARGLARVYGFTYVPAAAAAPPPPRPPREEAMVQQFIRIDGTTDTFEVLPDGQMEHTHTDTAANNSAVLSRTTLPGVWETIEMAGEWPAANPTELWLRGTGVDGRLWQANLTLKGAPTWTLQGAIA